MKTKKIKPWAVVVAQLVEQLLLTLEIHGSNPVIGKFYFISTLLRTVLKRREKRKKGPGLSLEKKKLLLT